MQTPVPGYLQEVLDACPGGEGRVADYIPELAAADPDTVAVAVTTLDGEVHAAGDMEAPFTIQSISKPFVYALALRDRGLKDVLATVGVEPTGDAFNQISLERDTGRPRNPMINVGAIVTHSLVGDPDDTDEERDAQIVEGLSAFAGRRLELDESAFESEVTTAHRNMALAHMVRSHGIVSGDPDLLVRGYTRQCALTVDVRDLAVMAATLANGGTNPVTGAEVVPEWVARQVLSVMATCGMYDAAGDWFSTVGIPAKSGVSGGILGALPGQVGLGVFSPRLDAFGTSARGVRICERLSRDMGLHLMGTPTGGPTVIREEDPAVTQHTFEIQGPVHFAGADAVLRAMAEIEQGPARIVVDLSRVTSIDDLGRRMIRSGVETLTEEGHEVTTVDPETLLGE